MTTYSSTLMPPITDVEKEKFDAVVAAIRGGQPGLMRVSHYGTPRAVIVLTTQDDQRINIIPLAVLMDENLFDELTPPDDAMKPAGPGHH